MFSLRVVFPAKNWPHVLSQVESSKFFPSKPPIFGPLVLGPSWPPAAPGRPARHRRHAPSPPPTWSPPWPRRAFVKHQGINFMTKQTKPNQTKKTKCYNQTCIKKFGSIIQFDCSFLRNDWKPTILKKMRRGRPPCCQLTFPTSRHTSRSFHSTLGCTAAAPGEVIWA